MKIERLFRIIYILLDKKSVTATELAERLEVSVRTIYRDIDVLSSAGIPIYASSGKGGGISILDSFILNKSAISEEDQEYILMALQNLSATESTGVESTLKRVSELFQKSDVSWIEVDYSRWGNSKADEGKFEKIKVAILNKRKLEFIYYNSYGNEGLRKIEPLKLVFKSKSWYLQGYCCDKEGYRTFKVNRMSNLVLLDDSIEGIHTDIPKIENLEYGKELNQTVKLKFRADMAYRVYDEFEKESIKRLEDGTFIVTVDVPPGNWINGYILAFGTAVEVLEPLQLKEDLIKEIKKMKEMYNN